MFGHTGGNIWRVRLVEWRECIFFEHGWDDFAEDNGVAFFTHIIESSMDVAISRNNGLEKISPATNAVARRH
jgi:hypothetical protein